MFVHEVRAQKDSLCRTIQKSTLTRTKNVIWLKELVCDFSEEIVFNVDTVVEMIGSVSGEKADAYTREKYKALKTAEKLHREVVRVDSNRAFFAEMMRITERTDRLLSVMERLCKKSIRVKHIWGTELVEREIADIHEYLSVVKAQIINVSSREHLMGEIPGRMYDLADEVIDIEYVVGVGCLVFRFKYSFFLVINLHCNISI